MAAFLGLGLALLGIIAGATLPVQAIVNSTVARGFGTPILGAAVSFAAGTVLLLLLSVIWARVEGLETGWRGLPAWMFVGGGTLGVIYMISVVFLTPRIGTATTMALVIAGQLLSGLLVDRLGLFGLTAIPLTTPRMAGAAMVLAGALLARFG